MSSPPILTVRELRSEVHRVLDRLWRGQPYGVRGNIYAWLAGEMGLSPEDCHIRFFDREKCEWAIGLLSGMTPRRARRLGPVVHEEHRVRTSGRRRRDILPHLRAARLGS